MNCCDEQGNCRQGRDCPVRVCRQRAGKPADYTIFTKGIEEVEAESERQAKSDLKSILFIASCILAFFLIVWSSL
jgi:hypothetical protein